MDDETGRLKTIGDLISVMAALRTPVTGCPWDLEQSFRTIAPYTIEEAYEVADAIERGDLAELKDELGDLLFQVVYHARMAEEQSAFAFEDVVDGVTRKMLRRHPHVFGTPEERAAGAAPGFWARVKAAEKAAKAAEQARLGVTPSEAASLLDDIPLGLPALSRAIKLQDKAAHVGFDWPSLVPVFAKLKEEIAELEEVALPADPRGPRARCDVAGALAPEDAGPGAEARAAALDPAQRRRIEEELGDMLFVVANIARHLQLDPEAALRGANEKFRRRFRHIEARLAEQGRTPAQSTLEEMDSYWDEARAADKRKG